MLHAIKHNHGYGYGSSTEMGRRHGKFVRYWIQGYDYTYTIKVTINIIILKCII